MDSNSGHAFCLVSDIPLKAFGADIWTIGYVKHTCPSEDHITLHYNYHEVQVSTAMLDPTVYDKGVLFTCLGSREKDGSLVAKVLRNSDGMKPEVFIKCASL